MTDTEKRNTKDGKTKKLEKDAEVGRSLSFILVRYMHLPASILYVSRNWPNSPKHPGK